MRVLHKIIFKLWRCTFDLHIYLIIKFHEINYSISDDRFSPVSTCRRRRKQTRTAMMRIDRSLWQREDAPVDAESLCQHSPVVGATVGRIQQHTQLTLHLTGQPAYTTDAHLHTHHTTQLSVCLCVCLSVIAMTQSAVNEFVS